MSTSITVIAFFRQIIAIFSTRYFWQHTSSRMKTSKKPFHFHLSNIKVAAFFVCLAKPDKGEIIDSKFGNLAFSFQVDKLNAKFEKL